MHEDRLTCETCAWWNGGAPALANAVRDPAAPADVGTCQIYPPELVATKHFAVSMYPTTHASRGACRDWESGEIPDDGAREPEPLIEAAPAADNVTAVDFGRRAG